MAVADFTIKQGDTLPALNFELIASDGSTPNLSGATVTFVMRQLSAIAPSTNAAASVVSASQAQVSYTFTAADTATAGIYAASFVVAFSGGGQQQFPTDGYLEVAVEENLTTSGGQTIVGLGEVKEYLRIGNTTKTEDDLLIRFIRASVPVIENLVGNVIVREYNEWYDGGQHFVQLRHKPLYQLIAVDEYRGPIDYTQEIIGSPDQGQIYSVETDLSRIVRRTAGGGVMSFPQMPQSVHVVYQAGRSPVPDNIIEANKELLRVNYQRTQQRPAAGWGNTTQYADDDQLPAVPMGFFVPQRVKEMLFPHRRAPSVA